MKIIVCGLNGAGKSTLGKILAKELGIYFFDNEDLYFPKTNSDYIYDNPRSRDEVNILFDEEERKHDSYVFAAVKGDYGIEKHDYDYVILIDVPKKIRLKRINQRSYEKFGNRVMPGGDLYENERKFVDMVSKRSKNYVDDWLETLDCPIIKINGTKRIEENIVYIKTKLNDKN